MFEHELKNAYIGEVWTPWANTVAYRPLTETTTMYDQSWNNYNLTKTDDGSFTTLWNVSCFYNGWSSIGYFTLNSAPKIPSGNADRTILLWARPSSYSSSYSRYFLDYGGSSAGTAVYLTINTSKKYYASVSSKGITWNTMPTNAWSLMTFVSSGNTFYLYANGELQWSNSNATINTTAVSSSYPFSLMGQNTSTSTNYQVRWYLSEVIIEDRAWTATEIANYFNNNKEKYWL
jgi:hypothetical protein